MLCWQGTIQDLTPIALSGCSFRPLCASLDGSVAQERVELRPPEARTSRLVKVAGADDYVGLFAGAPEVRTPFASPCDRWAS